MSSRRAAYAPAATADGFGQMERLTAAIEAASGQPVRGNKFHCPAHPDRNPSGSITRGENGGILLHCFAGCSFDEIVAALPDLEIGDLFPAKTEGNARQVATYDYLDEGGKLLHQTVRYVPKAFKQRRPDGRGGWIWSLKGHRVVLYRLPDVLRAVGTGAPIYVVDGEKDADAIARAGGTATCCPMGMGSFRRADTRALDGAGLVIVVADRDGGEGLKQARRVALDLVPRVLRVELVEPAKGKDAHDHLTAGLSLEEFVPVESPNLIEAGDEPTNPPTAPAPILLRMSDVAVHPVEWLWPGYLPRGKQAVLDGDPGLGKSTMTLDLAARLTTASPMPDGFRPPDPVNVVLLNAEDGVADTMRPRLEAAGADLERVVVLDGVLRDGLAAVPSLPSDVGIVEDALQSVGAALLIVDPLMAYLHEAVNSYNDQHVRKALHPLKLLAEKHGATILLVRHLNKGTGSNAVYRGGGSIGIIGAARIGWLVARHPDDDNRRIMAITKSNLGGRPSSLAFRVATDASLGCGRIIWEGSADYTAEQLLSGPGSPEERRERDEAAEFILAYLADGPQPATDVKKAGNEAGFNDRALDRARSRAGVTSKREGYGRQGRNLWYPPGSGQPIPAMSSMPEAMVGMASMAPA